MTPPRKRNTALLKEQRPRFFMRASLRVVARCQVKQVLNPTARCCFTVTCAKKKPFRK